jgi:type IV secretion system protein VirD4
VRNAGLLGDEGIIVGKYRDRFLTLPGKQSVMLSAPTRSGKGVGVVVPNLLAWQDSAVVVDIKSENFAITAGFRAAHGQAVYAWAPFAEERLARTAGTRSVRSAWPIATSLATRWPSRRCCTPQT